MPLNWSTSVFNIEFGESGFTALNTDTPKKFRLKSLYGLFGTLQEKELASSDIWLYRDGGMKFVLRTACIPIKTQGRPSTHAGMRVSVMNAIKWPFQVRRRPESPLCTAQPPWRCLEGQCEVAGLHQAQCTHRGLLAGDRQTHFIAPLNVATRHWRSSSVSIPGRPAFR